MVYGCVFSHHISIDHVRIKTTLSSTFWFSSWMRQDACSILALGAKWKYISLTHRWVKLYHCCSSNKMAMLKKIHESWYAIKQRNQTNLFIKQKRDLCLQLRRDILFQLCPWKKKHRYVVSFFYPPLVFGTMCDIYLSGSYCLTS